MTLTRSKPQKRDAKVRPLNALTPMQTGQDTIPQVTLDAQRPLRSTPSTALQTRAAPKAISVKHPT